ncbi:related to sugar transporter [Fusarium fujikuroi]|nr:related to sugar transporter [Fusarium fujikuroi]
MATDIDQPHEARSWLNIAIVVFVTFGSLSYGYCSSIIASTLGQPTFLEYFHLTPEYSNSTALLGACNGLFQTGGLIGALSIGYLADRLSRRGAIAIAALILVLGGALQAGSVNIGMFLAVRTLTGIGVGLAVGTTPLYQSEVSPPHSRGLLVGLHGVFICTGYALAGWVGYACYTLKGDIQWRLPMAIQVIPPALLLAGVYFLPESPRWRKNSLSLHPYTQSEYVAKYLQVIQHDRNDDALAVLTRIHHDAQDPDGHFAAREFHLIREQCTIDNAKGPVTYRELLTNIGNLKRVALGFLTMAGAQCTGTIVINNYGVVLYSGVGYTGRAAIALTAGWVTVGVPGNMVTSIFIDRLGRIKFMIIGYTGIIIALLGEIIVLALLEKKQSFSLNAAAIFFLYMHIAFFSSCIDASTYIYASEIFPTRMRATGISVSLSGLFLASLTFTQAASSAFAQIGWKYYILFTVLSIAMLITLCLWFPETKGLTLEEIAGLFNETVAVVDEEDKAQAAHIDNTGKTDV